jgi:Family of unknown function (DUF5681)
MEKQSVVLQNKDENMTFRPGQSGNPGGLRKYKDFANALRMELAVLDDGDQRGMRKVAASLIREALKGNIAAVREIADRLDGKPIQQHQVDMEERIKLIAVVPQKAASTEDWLKLVGEQQKTIEHEPIA